jgi:hypothetical protein
LQHKWGVFIKLTKIAFTTKWEIALANDRWETTRKSSKKAVPNRTTEVSIIHAGLSERIMKKVSKLLD